MRRFLNISFVVVALISAPLVANAADPGPPPYRAPAVPYYNWSGFYLGAHVGIAWSTDDNSDSVFLGGGQAGFNYQVGQWVLGVEGQISATSGSDSVSLRGPIGSVSASGSLDWISTLAFRAGWAFDRWLVYGKVGGAWAHVSSDFSINMPGVINFRNSGDDTISGWMLGVGTEYALWDNWTAKLEYNMMDFGNDLDSKVHVLKAGVNYRFGFGRY